MDRHMNKQIKLKMTKGKFEEYLWERNNKQPLEYRRHDEFDYDKQKSVPLTLYYNDDGHIGTWQRGSKGGKYNCWTFEERLPNE
jgi:predicted peptidase